MSKFKVGDKVRIIKSNRLPGCVGDIVEIKSVNPNAPYLDKPHYGVGRVFVCLEDELELAPFNKSDLKDGMVLEYRNGSREMVFGSRSIDMNGWHNLEQYSESLTDERYHFPNHNIDKVYKVNNNTIHNFKDVFKDEYLELIWEREPDYKEMTVEEIEKELGYKIKVIADKE